MEIANLSDAEFKTLLIRMLRELTEYGNNMNEEMEVIPSEIKKNRWENQDGGVGRHTAPPRTTRPDRKSKGKEVQQHVDKKETYIQTGRRDGDGQPGRRGLVWPWRDRDWRSVGRTRQAV